MSGERNECAPHDYDVLIHELGEQNLEVIRYSSYRTAAKLRFIQKKTNFYMIDIWNAIEAIRENGLHVHQDTGSQMSVTKLETLIASIYYQLNKRLPPSQSINLDESISYMLSWLAATYDPTSTGRVRVFAIKTALALMCFGKLIDKLRYVFTLISDSNSGFLIESRFKAFLSESMALPVSVFESAAFNYEPTLASTIFDFSQPIDLATFLNVFLDVSSPPHCISWLVILSRLIDAEQVTHAIACDACHRHPFKGLRYKCQKCFNYNLCQDCFWRGRTSGSHNADTHACKEYIYWQSQGKQIGHSLRKSFRCKPTKQQALLQSEIQFPEETTREKRFNLTHVVPPSPLPSVHQFNGLLQSNSDLESLYACSNQLYRSPPSTYMSNNGSSSKLMDEEHLLISKYASALSKSKRSSISVKSASSGNVSKAKDITVDISQQQKVITQLEARNREIMREIGRLRQEHNENETRDNQLKSSAYYSTSSIMNHNQEPTAITELAGLRSRKEELESHLSALQDSRRELMIQLESLMKLLKNHNTLLAVSASCPASGANSASSTLNRSKVCPSSSNTLSTTHTTLETQITSSDTLTMTSSSNISTNVNRDLLFAADSVTNAMSSLVKELNSKEETVSTNELRDKVITHNNEFNNRDETGEGKEKMKMKMKDNQDTEGTDKLIITGSGNHNHNHQHRTKKLENSMKSLNIGKVSDADWNRDQTNKHGASTTTNQESNMSKVWPLIMNR